MSSSFVETNTSSAHGGGSAAPSSTATSLTSTRSGPTTPRRTPGGIYRLGGTMPITTSPISANTPNNCTAAPPGCPAASPDDRRQHSGFRASRESRRGGPTSGRHLREGGFSLRGVLEHAQLTPGGPAALDASVVHVCHAQLTPGEPAALDASVVHVRHAQLTPGGPAALDRSVVHVCHAVLTEHPSAAVDGSVVHAHAGHVHRPRPRGPRVRALPHRCGSRTPSVTLTLRAEMSPRHLGNRSRYLL